MLLLDTTVGVLGSPPEAGSAGEDSAVPSAPGRWMVRGSGPSPHATVVLVLVLVGLVAVSTPMLLPSCGLQRVLTEAQAMFDGTLAPRDFLEQVDDSLVAAIAEASASMVVTRCEGLLRYARSREPGTRPSS